MYTFAELAAMKVADLAGYCRKIVRAGIAIDKAKEVHEKPNERNIRLPILV